MKLFLFECESRDGCERILDRIIRCSPRPDVVKGDDDSPEVEVQRIEINDQEMREIRELSPDEQKNKLFAKFGITNLESSIGMPKGPYYYVAL